MPGSARAAAIPFGEIETVFLDAGNTLISMDFAWIGGELARLGARASAAAIERAEARIRPLVSRRITAGRSTEARDAQRFYLRSILEALAGELDPAQDAGGLERLCDELIPVLRGTGTTRLWSYVLPGVPEALAELRRARLRLVVVSNSDGTVERGLAEVGLRGLVDVVVDSHLVGFEKPDPRIFQHALEVSGSRPESTLHVGDMYAADVAGARAAGVHAVLLDPYGDWHEVDCERAPDLRALAARIVRERAS